MASARTALKRIVLGRPKPTGELEHTLLPKTIALPVFASDPLSSNAYATQEAMLVLALAGTAALSLIVPISIAVACVLAVVVISYRQTVRAYPDGGGAYRVSSENLGRTPALLAAAALLGDYVLTVSVSVTAGVDAIVAAAPGVAGDKVLMASSLVVFVALANLRGAKESGAFFAIPTYGFVLAIYLMLIFGLTKCVTGCPQAESAGQHLEPAQALTFFLVLRAFAAGTTALTGVEAISNGTGAFRYPQSRNAATTLGIMGCLTISMFLGISWLARHTGVVFTEETHLTVVAQIGDAVFGGGPLFYFLQAMTAAILILAANTAYQDFPRLSSILAVDRYMPRQLANRGDRLVFSNGVIILSALAVGLIYLFDANLSRLIQLYLVGVFISFTLSQTGLVVHFRRTRESRWKGKSVLSGFGASVTGIVLVVIAGTKFLEGAWIIMISIPVLMFMMHSIHKHYQDVRAQLVAEHRRPVDRRPGHQHMLILVQRVDAAAARALGYTRSIGPAEITAVTFDPANAAPWTRLAPDVPLEVLGNGSRNRALRRHLRERREELAADDFLTVVVPELLRGRGLSEILLHPGMGLLKASLLPERGVQVLDIPIGRDEIAPGDDLMIEPARNHVRVLASGVHNATLQAIEYAETLRPTTLNAVSFGIIPEDTEKLGNDWLEAVIPLPLEMEESPFRAIGGSLLSYVRRLNPDGVNRVVTIVIPEFIVGKKRHQILHGQTALIVKRHLLFEPGVVVVSVPYHLD